MSEETLRVRGKHRMVASALLLVPFTLISSLAIGNSALNAAAQPRKNTIVFAVAGEPDDHHMDAVVLVDGKQLRTPYTDEDGAHLNSGRSRCVEFLQRGCYPTRRLAVQNMKRVDLDCTCGPL